MGQVKVTEAYLSGAADGIRYVNGSSVTYTPAQFENEIKALKKTLVSKTIAANGSYDPEDDDADGYSGVTVNVPNSYAAGDEGKVVSNGALVAQTARSSQITANGTYDTTTNNSVTVNVSGGGGGGGTNAIYVSSNAPTSADGSLNDLWVYSKSARASDLIALTLTRKYTIKITVAARDTGYSFTYYGARELEFIFDDGYGNDVLLQDIDSSFTYSGRLEKTKLFDKSLSSYSEASGLPTNEITTLTVPAGYTLKGFRVGWRNDSSWRDFWRTFTVTETFVYNGAEYSRIVLSETDMVYAQWNVGPYVDFTSDMVFPEYALSNEVRYIKLSDGWTQIDSLDRYIDYAL